MRKIVVRWLENMFITQVTAIAVKWTAKIEFENSPVSLVNILKKVQGLKASKIWGEEIIFSNGVQKTKIISITKYSPAFDHKSSNI